MLTLATGLLDYHVGRCPPSCQVHCRIPGGGFLPLSGYHWCPYDRIRPLDIIIYKKLAACLDLRELRMVQHVWPFFLRMGSCIIKPGQK